MEANVTMTGWVGGDIEYRGGRDGKQPSASFRLGCTPRIRRGGDWADGETTWFTVTCFRALADNAASSIGKGDPVMVVGRLRTQVWGSEDDRHERTVLEATTIGHDLTRGTAAFKKSDRVMVVDDPMAEVGDMIVAVERNAVQEAAPTKAA